MKTLIILLVLTFIFSSVGLAFEPYVQEYKPQSNYIPGLPEPFSQNQGSAYVPMAPYPAPQPRQWNQRGNGHIYIQPDWNTHQNDLRDQNSWASPQPNPFANDPRNPIQQRAKPRGYIIQY